jgi:hypothetical protein
MDNPWSAASLQECKERIQEPESRSQEAQYKGLGLTETILSKK